MGATRQPAAAFMHKSKDGKLLTGSVCMLEVGVMLAVEVAGKPNAASGEYFLRVTLGVARRDVVR